MTSFALLIEVLTMETGDQTVDGTIYDMHTYIWLVSWFRHFHVSRSVDECAAVFCHLGCSPRLGNAVPQYDEREDPLVSSRGCTTKDKRKARDCCADAHEVKAKHATYEHGNNKYLLLPSRQIIEMSQMLHLKQKFVVHTAQQP